MVGCRVYLKCENFQRVGAFKFRGAYNAISQLSHDERAAGVITHSSGNHAQGVALAARLLGVKAVIVMPEDAPAIKREATTGYGAEIVSCPAVDREKVCHALQETHGYTLIHPYDNHQIIAGAGTAAWELFDEVGELDYLFVPVGGGGLISGSALAAASRSPRCRVVGVEPELGDDAGRSWRDNRIHRLEEVPATIADGLRTRFVGERNLPIMRQYVADMLTVSEEDIKETLRFIWNRLKIIVEPSAAVALAPLFTGQRRPGNEAVGILLSGGNVDLVELASRLKKGAPRLSPVPVEKEASPPPPSSPRVLVTDQMDEAGLELLKQVAQVDAKLDLSEDQFLNEVGNYQAIIVGPRRRVTEQILEYAFALRTLGVMTSRLDHIDVSTARNLGIEVVSPPGSRAVAIAEHTMGRMLRLAVEYGDGRLEGKTVGIVGFGRVGRQVASRAHAFDMRVLANQPRLTPQLALSAGVEASDLSELLRRSDYVTLHVPFKAETDTIIGAAELALMNPSACLINSGHTSLVDEEALLRALEQNRLAAASLPAMPEPALLSESASVLRQHPRVSVAPHVTTILSSRHKESSLAVASQIASLLRASQASESLSLELVPIGHVLPHEQVDDKRVGRLMKRLQADRRLVNPPVTTCWKGRYIILDGATRYTALQRLGYPNIIVQVVSAERHGFQMHTWYHVISSDQPFAVLQEVLAQIDGLKLRPLSIDQIPAAFDQEGAICYFLDRDGSAILAEATNPADRLSTVGAVVARYTAWGEVERTLLTDLPPLLGQFPRLTAVAIFPQFQPELVFDVAREGGLFPAGLTRFIIPGRILRLNADLERLRRDEPIAAKKAWFNHFLQEKLARSRLRYYQEPVILLDE